MRLFARASLCIAFLALVLIGVVALSAPAQAQSLSPEERARLQAEYDKLQLEIVEWQKILDETKAKKNTLQGDVSALNALIKKAEAQIKQKNISITNLGNEIKAKNQRIGELESKLDRGKESLARILRIQNEVDTMSLAELVLSAEDFSTLFGDVDALAAVTSSLHELFADVRDTRAQTEAEKQQLAAKQDAELDAKYEVEVTKKQIARSEAEKKELLQITKEAESSYQKVLAERQRQAETIRSALFGLRDAEGIPFGTALSYAQDAEAATGVRAAVILAILSQESDLGKNVGSCLMTDLTTGDGVGKNTGRVFQKVMKAPRDTVPFERITGALGLAWATTPVSCPLGTVYTASRGYGGAMGPSQFIPSTWELYEKRLSSALGVGTPNPWNAAHAVMATALYMQDLGADGGTYSTERNAACRYYSGRACDSRTPTNYTYGNSVMAKAEAFQEDIDFLKGI
jgi:peptidoglycan hydrolase CwlO-like protein